LFTTAGACELFKRLEEVSTRAAQGGGADYLTVLSQSIHLATASVPERHRENDRAREREREAECLRRLTTLRFALARYFARCTMIDVGGKHTISFSAT
jgi:nuclear pore complex protein Nup85